MSCCGFLYLLQDENDNPPEFSKSSYIVKIPENIIAGESLHAFKVTVLSLECTVWSAQPTQHLNTSNSSNTVQHIQSPLTGIALLLAYSTNSFDFLGVCFYVLFYMLPLASTVLFVLILHNVSKCSARMQDIDFYRKNHQPLYSFSCMHSEDSYPRQ